LNGEVVADIDAGQALGKCGLIQRRKYPLGEVVRKSLGQEVMAAECLDRVIKNRRIASFGQRCVQSGDGFGYVIVHARQVCSSKESEGLRGGGHSS
jgi:hypothetical protein